MKTLKKEREKKSAGRKVTIRQTWQYHLLMLPGIVVVVLYTIIPFFGNVMAFQNFQPILGFFRSRWVGLVNFERALMMPEAGRVFRNSLQIAVGKLMLSMMMSIFFAVLLNEIQFAKFKKTVQTICFLPHFLSWVILATIFRNLLDINGIVNQMLMGIGVIKEPLMFLGSNSLFQGVLIMTDVWKGFGYGAIIFLAALMGISPELYEAADIDGAGRLAKIWHITLPGIRTTVVLVATLNIANVLNAGFDQVYNLYSPIVYKSGDIIDTYVYRMSFLSAQYSLATAIGLMKSAISFVLIVMAHGLARKFANYRIF